MARIGVIFAAVVFAIMVLLLITNVSKCGRDKKVNKLNAARLKVLNVDSIRSHVEDSIRTRLWAENLSLRVQLERAERNYKVVVQKDVKTEYVYRNNPTTENCNHALTSKNNRIDTLESRIVNYTKRDSLQLGLISSYERTRLQKDSTIRALNLVTLEAINKLDKALKPKQWGVGVQAGYGAAVVNNQVKIGPGIQVGLSYNIIRF